jgi:signal transduction histidine kinase
MTPMMPARGFTIVCRVKPGGGDAIRAFGVKLEKSLQDYHQTASLFELRHLRWTLFDRDKRAIYFAASEADFDQYVDDAIALSACTGIDPVFEHLDGFPADWRCNRAAVLHFARKHRCQSLAERSVYGCDFDSALSEITSVPTNAVIYLEADQSLQSLSIRESERKRIAQELHDTTVQELASAKLYIENAQKFAENARHRDRDLADAIHLLEHSLKDLRTLSYMMHPPMLDELGIAAALRWYLRGFEGRTGIKAILKATGALPRFSPATKTALFRIVQEALTNVYRHSESKVVTVSLGKSRNSVVVSVADRGKGLPPSIFVSAANVVPGLGITGMRARAEQLQGSLVINSDRRGTTVRVVLPLTSIRRQLTATKTGCHHA